MGFSGVSSAIIMRDMFAAGRPEAACILVGAAVGLVLGVIPGLINGLLVARLRVPPFIATLGTYGVANGMALYLSNGFPITFLPPRAQKIGNSFIAYLLPDRGFTFFHRPEGLKSKELRSLSIVPVTVLVAVLLVFAFSARASANTACHRREQGCRHPRRDQRTFPPAAHLHPVLHARRRGRGAVRVPLRDRQLHHHEHLLRAVRRGRRGDRRGQPHGRKGRDRGHGDRHPDPDDAGERPEHRRHPRLLTATSPRG
jgi:hypothetical protein